MINNKNITLLIEAPELSQSTVQSIIASLQDLAQVESSSLYHKSMSSSNTSSDEDSLKGKCLLLTLKTQHNSSAIVTQIMSCIRNYENSHGITPMKKSQIWLLSNHRPVSLNDSDSLTQNFTEKTNNHLNDSSAANHDSKAASVIPDASHGQSSTQQEKKNETEESSASQREEEKMQRLRKMLAPQKFRFAVRPNKKRTRISQIFTQGFGEFNSKLEQRHIQSNLSFVKKRQKGNMFGLLR